MRSHAYTTEAIVVSRKVSGEADYYMTLLTKDKGKLGVTARSVRKVTSRKRGHLEVGSYVRVGITDGDFPTITEAVMIQSFPEIRANLKKLSLMYYFMEVASSFARDPEYAEVIFDILLSYIEKLTVTTTLKTLRRDFVCELMIACGFWPEGKVMSDPDQALDGVLERMPRSLRIGKKLML